MGLGSSSGASGASSPQPTSLADTSAAPRCGVEGPSKFYHSKVTTLVIKQQALSSARSHFGIQRPKDALLFDNYALYLIFLNDTQFTANLVKVPVTKPLLIRSRALAVQPPFRLNNESGPFSQLGMMRNEQPLRRQLTQRTRRPQQWKL